MARVIFYLIVMYVIAKILGEVLQFLRRMFSPRQSNIQSTQKKQPQKFENIQDVEYEEINDKK
jgi:hypothetical protein